MIKEALQYLSSLYVDATKPVTLNLDTGEHCTRVSIGGTIHTFEHNSPPVSAIIDDIDSLEDAMRRFCSDDSLESATVWVMPNLVLVQLDGGRNDFREHRLSFIPGLNRNLRSIETHTRFTHLELLDFLKFNLQDVSFEESFQLAISNLKFTTTDEQTVTRQGNSDAMGASIRSELLCLRDMPELVSFSMPAYPSMEFMGCTLEIHCSVKIDTKERQILMQPLPGQIEQAKRKAAAALFSVVSDFTNEATVLLGQPE